MKNFSKETSITVAGVSEHPEKYGHKIFKDLLAAGYNVVGINPKGGIILEQEIYPSLVDVPRKTELLIVVVPPQFGIEVVRDAKNMGITHVWLQPGAESDEIIKYAQANGMDVTYNACFMKDQGIW